jgi:hypothetical protein
MPRKKTNKNYFGEEQELAVIRYLNSDSVVDKNKIFNEYLRNPLITMVESIIRRYKLYRKDYVFDDQHTDTLSFLITKLDKYNPDKQKKAYSYFGTICKNYLMGVIQKDAKETNRSVSYEDISSSLDDNIEMSYLMDLQLIDYKEVIVKINSQLEEFIATAQLTENEEKLGYALMDIFSNFENIFQIGNGNKFNKNLILLSLREMTSLSTKDIRVSLKKFKKFYKGIIEEILKN